jgi:hypothetical protein
MSDQDLPPFEQQSTGQQQPQRQFGYVPDPHFTAQFGEQLKHDDELQRLLSIEREAIFSDTTAPKLFGWISNTAARLKQWVMDQLRLGSAFGAAYTEAGGNVANLRRIVQVAVDQSVQEELANVDLPGPDSWIKPKLREAIVFAVGKRFDKFIGQ